MGGTSEEQQESGQGHTTTHVQASKRHYYVDVPNPEESNYEACEQHVSIDPAFREELQRGNNGDISEFLCLPELIPAKKRRRQQPLLDYTHSRILTSADYMKGLEDLLAKKEEVAAAAKKKKEEKEATKEQRKIAKEKQQKEKEERAAERARKKEERIHQQNAKKVPGNRRRAGEGRETMAIAAASGGEASAGGSAYGGGGSRGFHTSTPPGGDSSELQLRGRVLPQQDPPLRGFGGSTQTPNMSRGPLLTTPRLSQTVPAAQRTLPTSKSTTSVNPFPALFSLRSKLWLDDGDNRAQHYPHRTLLRSDSTMPNPRT